MSRRSCRLGGIASTRAIAAACSGWRRLANGRASGSRPGARSGPDGVLAIALEVVKKSADQVSVQVRRCRGGRAGRGVCCWRFEQQPHRVAVGADRVRAGVPLGDHPVGEERLQSWSEMRSSDVLLRGCSRVAGQPTRAVPGWRTNTNSSHLDSHARGRSTAAPAALEGHRQSGSCQASSGQQRCVAGRVTAGGWTGGLAVSPTRVRS